MKLLRSPRFWQIVCIPVFLALFYATLEYLNPRTLVSLFMPGFFAWFIILIALGTFFIYATQKTRERGLWKRMTPPPSYETVAAKISEIEAEMKRVGLWQEKPLDPEQYNFTRAFAMDTMSFDQWLQFIFIPRVKQIIETRGEFPPSSMVAAQAVREFDGSTFETDRLQSLLSEFDRLFN